MKANVINLEHRKDRLKQMKIELLKANLELFRHDGIDGTKVFFNHAVNKRMRAHFGCLQSFRNMLHLVRGTADYHLVMEDDVLLIDDFKKSVEMHLEKIPADWDMLYLGGHVKTLDNAVEEYNELFWKAKNVLGLYCWIIKDSSIDALLEVLNSRLWKADMLAIEFQQKSNTYMTRTCHAWVRESYSDISFEVIKPKLKY
jgi:GR25 family glycosyltransferase involved in LPS biosynthesis